MIFTVKVCYFGCFDEKNIFEKSCINLMLDPKDQENQKFSFKNLRFIFGGDPSLKADFYVIINYPPFASPDQSPNGWFHEPHKTIVIHNEPWCFESYQSYGVKTWPEEWRLPSPSKYLKVCSPVAACNLGLVQWMFKYTPEQLLNKDFSQDKSSKMISTIISNKNFDPGHISRNDFVRKYKQALDITVYGRNQELSDFKNLSNENKYIAIAPYKYYLAVENNREPNYITEKLFEGIVCECLVFYDGAPNARTHINERAFIPINIKEDGLEKTYEIIKTAIENNEYEKRLTAIKEEKKKIIEMSLFPMIHNTITKEFHIELKDIDQINNDVGFTKDEKILKKHPLYNSFGFIKNEITELTQKNGVNLYSSIEKLLNHFEKNVYPKFSYLFYGKKNIILNEWRFFEDSKKYEDSKNLIPLPFPWETSTVNPQSMPPLEYFYINYFIPYISLFKTLRKKGDNLPTFKTVISGDHYIKHFNFLNSFGVPIEVHIIQKSVKDTAFYESKYLNLKLKPLLYEAVNLVIPERAPLFKKYLELTGTPNELERKYLFSFVGAYQPTEYISTLRKDFFDVYENHPLNYKEFYIKNTHRFHYNNYLFGTQEKSQQQLEEETDTFNKVLFSSVFSLCLPGTGSNSMRLSESLAAGAIPVIFDRIDDPVVDLPDNDCVIKINLNNIEIEDVYDILNYIKLNRNIKEMSEKCKKFYINSFTQSNL